MAVSVTTDRPLKSVNEYPREHPVAAGFTHLSPLPLLHMNEYDGLLAAMPASVVIGAIVGWLGAVPITVGLVAGSLLAGILVVVSLFVVPPVA